MCISWWIDDDESNTLEYLKRSNVVSKLRGYKV